MRHRLQFLFDDKPVGRFVGRAYPARAGRYRFSPFRGEGHALFAAALRQTAPVLCHFTREGRRIPLQITGEQFVPDGTQSCWFVDITRVGR
jgi:hypothetical protein